ncbi:hypothetical protein [Acanthopleuribacter pedis]|uniref:Uncharacterized protein n=1 Tax=Acanthopleuribacter pedis TaxID=442870 RepID=A0A8J7QP29_9BACT|nr:hypothetical protein [Acanthopleuribacter pedis]MBO1321520.1 hypothetical protein [Acanthopleuribacter pedis]
MKSILIFSGLFALGSMMIGVTALSVYIQDQQERAEEAAILDVHPTPEELNLCILELNQNLLRCSKQAGHFIGDPCTQTAMANWEACTTR